MALQDIGGQFALDLQGLQRLKHTARQDASAGVEGAAQQFEALFIQMMMKSMRDAVPTSGLVDSEQSRFYQSLLDQQWSQTMASRGIGLAESLVNQLEASGMVKARDSAGSDIDALIAGIPRGAPRVLQDALRPDLAEEPAEATDTVTDRTDTPRRVTAPESFMDELATAPAGFMDSVSAIPATAASASPSQGPGKDAQRDKPVSTGVEALPETPKVPRAAPPDTPASPADHVQAFLDRLSGPARAASRTTGVPAELILAQAALETGWGRHEIATAEGRNSHNLFGIKAGGSWQGATTEVTTHEYYQGRRTTISDSFRVYDSFEAAFTDYARLIGDNPRYARVTTAPSAEQAARELQAGGYATDPAYADKLIAVMGSLGSVAAGESLVFLRY